MNYNFSSNFYRFKSNKWDANMFTENVFKMFDLNGDEALTFEEFIFATSAQNFDNVHDKLGWLFDNVYDRVGLVFSHSKYYFKV